MKKSLQIAAFATLFSLQLKGEEGLSAVPGQTILPKEITGLFDGISADENSLQIRLKEKFAATLLRIDDGPNRQTRSGEIIHLKVGQHLTYIASDGICRIFYGNSDGVTGVVAVWLPQAAPEKSKSIKAVAKVNLTTKTWAGVTDEERRKLNRVAGMTEKNGSLVPKGKNYQVSNLDDLLLKVLKSVAIKPDGVDLRFKDEGSRYRVTVDGKEPHISKYGEVIRIEPGQKLKLTEKHQSITIIAVKDDGGTIIAAAEIQRHPLDGIKYSVATGRVDKSHEKFVSLEKAEMESLLRSAGILEDDQKK